MGGQVTRSAEEAFQHGYYQRYYRERPWRRRGDRPALFRSILRVLKPWFGGRLLDVGCGEGQFLRRSARHFDASGVDVSIEGVEQARLASGLATISVATASELPFPDGSFAVVTCFDVLEHLGRPEAALAEAHRVLEPGGVIVLSTPNPSSLGRRLKGRRSFIYRDQTHVSVKRIEAWRELLATAGFEVLRDGTDTLWDSPYVPYVPNALQWIVFVGLSQLMWAVSPVYPWRIGENYVCFARKRPATSGGAS